MKPNRLFHRLLGLPRGWEVASVGWRPPESSIRISVREASRFWALETCPQCDGGPVDGYDHGKPEQWRHLDLFERPAFIECALPNAHCRRCGHNYGVRPPWQGKSKYFTCQFEERFLALTKAMSIDKACQLVGESEERVWSMVFAHVDQCSGSIGGSPSPQIVYRTPSAPEVAEIDDTLDFDLRLIGI